MANSSGHRESRWGGPEVSADMVRRYVQDRLSMRQIAAALGCSYGTVHMVLTTANVELRPRGGSRRRTADPVTRGPAPPAAMTGAAVPGTTSSHRPRSRS